MPELERELKKVRFQLQEIGRFLGPQGAETVSLLIEKNWGEEELTAAHDIFEKYDTQLQDQEKLNWVQFEADFRNELNVSYQGLKSVVLTFFRTGYWEDICLAYAKEHPVSEFSEILRQVRYKS